MGSYIVPGQAWDRVASWAQWKSEKARGLHERIPTTPRKPVTPQGQAAPKGQVERGTSSESGPPGCRISHRRSHRLLCWFRADPGELLTGENSEGLPEWALVGPDLAGGAGGALCLIPRHGGLGQRGMTPTLALPGSSDKEPRRKPWKHACSLRHWKKLLEAD